MKNRIFFQQFFPIFIVFICSCTPKDTVVLKDVELVPLKSERDLACDSLNVPFKSVNHLIGTDDFLYIAPSEVNGLLVLDWNNTHMESRKLPIEAQSLFLQDDDIYIYSSYNPLWKYNVKNEMYSKANIPDSLFPINHLSFFVKDSVYYFFSNLKGKQEAATLMNLRTKDFGQIGRLTTRYDDAGYRFRSARHLLEYKNGFLSIGKFVPVIEQFDSEGNLSGTFDMKTIPVISKNLKEEYILKGRTPYFITTDCCIRENELFLLVRDGESNSISKSIIEFCLKDSIEVKRHYLLTGCEKVSNFTLKEDTFVVFDYASAKLKFYPICK